MSAICAIRRFDGAPVPRSVLAPMLEALRHFGSEAAAWAPETPESPVALGCRPMRITPEDSYYHPPLRSADGRIALVADARIDNRSELAADLGLSAAAAGQRPDAAFILAAYEAWGPGCAPRLVGDFAFALWDDRRHQLFCARDGMGIRVLFYHQSPRRIALASLPQALVALDDVPARLNEQKIAESLVLFQDPHSTFFTGVHRLLPGHALTAGADGVRTERFWSPAPSRKIRFRSEGEYVDGFKEVFDRAVLDRVRSTGPVGIMLSGGLDSTAVAASAALQLGAQGGRLHAYHAAPRLGFQGNLGRIWVADESKEVEEVAGLYPNLDLRIHRTDGRTPFDYDEALFRMSGLPMRNPGNLPWWAGLHALAQADGVTVMLTGNQGNNTISYDGLASLRDLARRGRWAHLLHEVTAFARATRNGRRDVLREQVLLPMLPWGLGSRGQQPRTPQQAAAKVAKYSGIHPEFAAVTHVAERVLAEGGDSARTRRAGSVAYRVHGLNSPADGADVTNGYRPWFGIETREPAIDVRVVEFCLAIPGTLFLRNGRTRWLIREAMQNRLPASVLNRDRYGAQAADWSEWLPTMRGDLEAELGRLEHNDTASRCLDLPRLRTLLSQWPAQLGREHDSLYMDLLLRAMMTGRFIRWFEHTYT